MTHHKWEDIKNGRVASKEAMQNLENHIRDWRDGYHTAINDVVELLQQNGSEELVEKVKQLKP